MKIVNINIENQVVVIMAKYRHTVIVLETMRSNVAIQIQNIEHLLEIYLSNRSYGHTDPFHVFNKLFWRKITVQPSSKKPLEIYWSSELKKDNI